jgi:hypothetical protein
MTETPTEREEKARVRRRWLTLGEIVAIAAVVISGLTLWNSWSERKEEQAARAAHQRDVESRGVALLLRAKADGDGRTLALSPLAENQAIQSQTVRFPTSLKVTAAETSGDARIERGWFDEALVDARNAAKVKDTPGDARLPVLIETRFLIDGTTAHVDRAIYEVGYRTSSSLLGGTTVKLRGLSRVVAVTSTAAGQKQIDALWSARLK